jgi:hypothetical protein
MRNTSFPSPQFIAYIKLYINSANHQYDDHPVTGATESALWVPHLRNGFHALA